jgi:hypothetical protein
LTTTPSTKPKPFCFVLMPFAKNFSDIYEFGIKGACNDAGLYCERVDEQVFLGSMLERIYSQISRSDMLIADMTGKNPNVFYEVGYAHALGKNVILLTSVAEDIPFDLKHFPHIVYGSEIKLLRTSLVRHLMHLTSLDPKAPLTQVGLEPFLKNQRLANGGVVLEYHPKRPGRALTLLNTSAQTYQTGEFRVAIIAPSPFNRLLMNTDEVTLLPDGSFMHMLPVFDTLFPGAATKLMLYLIDGELPSEVNVQVRIFSSSGLRDFPLSIRRTAA